MLIGKVCKHCGDYIPPDHACKIEIDKSSKKYALNFMRPPNFFDHGKNRQITSNRQIKEICEREDKVYGGDSELDQQCDINKKRIDKEHTSQMADKIIENAYKEGVF